MERLLAGFGVPPSFIDQITRRLREDGRLPNAGRGTVAADIGPREATLILLAIAGSEFASRSRSALAQLAIFEIVGDVAPRLSRSFIASVEALLSSADAAATVREIRVARGNGRSSILYDDEYIEHFALVDSPGVPALSTQGIIWGGLISELETGLRGSRI